MVIISAVVAVHPRHFRAFFPRALPHSIASRSLGRATRLAESMACLPGFFVRDRVPEGRSDADLQAMLRAFPEARSSAASTSFGNSRPVSRISSLRASLSLSGRARSLASCWCRVGAGDPVNVASVFVHAAPVLSVFSREDQDLQGMLGMGHPLHRRRVCLGISKIKEAEVEEVGDPRQPSFPQGRACSSIVEREREGGGGKEKWARRTEVRRCASSAVSKGGIAKGPSCTPEGPVTSAPINAPGVSVLPG